MEKAKYGKAMIAKNKKTLKGVSLMGLSADQVNKMLKHSVHHSKKHLREMRNAMQDGKTFDQAHKIAQSKVGK